MVIAYLQSVNIFPYFCSDFHLKMGNNECFLHKSKTTQIQKWLESQLVCAKYLCHTMLWWMSDTQRITSVRATDV